MSRDIKAQGERVEIHVSPDSAIRDYVSHLRKRTEAYSAPLRETRAAVDLALGQASLTEALYRMRRDEDVV